MYPRSTIEEFIKLRSQGYSLARIAGQLDVSKGTLISWNAAHRSEIASLRAIELEALHEQILHEHQRRLDFLKAQQAKMEEELAKRSLADVPTTQLLRLSVALARQSTCLSAELAADRHEPESLRKLPFICAPLTASETASQPPSSGKTGKTAKAPPPEPALPPSSPEAPPDGAEDAHADFIARLAAKLNRERPPA